MKRFDNKALRALLSIIVSASVAVPILTLPLGTRDGISPALKVRRAYAATFPEEEIEGEEVVPPQEIEVDENIANGGTISATYTDGYDPSGNSGTYSDVQTYTVYQQFDQSGLKVELLDPMYFAEDYTTFYIMYPDTIIKEEPYMDSITLAQIPVGEGVQRIAVGDSWSKIETRDGIVGYVLTESLSIDMVWQDIDRTVWVDCDSLILRSGPDTSYDMVATLYRDDRLRCIAIADKWFKVITEDGTEGYVYTSFTTETPPPTPTPTPTPIPPQNTGGGGGGGGGGSSSGGGGTNYNQVVGGTYENVGNNGQTIANIAQSMLGVSYVWGASSASAVDCSGLVCYCYNQLGVSLPHQSQSLCSVGVPVAREDVQPGDIVCWDTGGGYCGHVGIYIGGGQCIDARGRAYGVVWGDIDRHPIVTIRRIFV
ncbi:SH3 domain-containing protein [Oscillospiraceae bacterium]|nr:SH3 domain-containing protein [Oscillospiraceae bacterium]